MLQDQDLISIQEVRAKVEQAYAAWTRYRSVSQAQADAIVEAMAGCGARECAASCGEGCRGNGLRQCARQIRQKYAGRGCAAKADARDADAGRAARDSGGQKIVEIGVPMGVVAAILPTTNPTSTAIYKTLISIKAGNGIVLAPHPRARACTCETAAILAGAAVQGRRAGRA